MTFPKRTFDKPIPISPLIALDRERCILCYRCTRFSEGVAEDGQLVARNRGAQSEIATFEDEPYRGAVLRQRDRALPRRRADLDAVPLRGAAVGDPERADRLRALPGRLQRPRDDARGQGQARPLAQPPGGRRRLALRQGPLRLPAPARADDRITRAARRGDAAASSRVSLGRGARRGRASCCARPAGRIVTALSGSETIEIAYGARPAPARRARRALGRAPRVDRRRRSTRSARRSRRSATRSSSSSSATSRSSSARRSSTSGSAQARRARRRDRHDRRPRHGAGRAGRAPRRRCRELARPASALGKRLRASERAS